MRIGLGLSVTALLRVTAAVIVGALAARSATIIDPAGDTIGASGAGWAVDVTMSGVTNIGGSMDPTKLVLTVSDPGYDAAGNVTTVTRTIRGIAHVRRQYPNGASKIISTDGTNTTATVAVDDWIYASTTIVSATAQSGFYLTFQGALSITNNSTLAYPKPIFGWINPQREVVGSSISVEGVAFHRHAKNSRQVACIKYSATDGTNTTADVLCADSALSVRVTQGYPPEVWPATISVTGLTQGVLAKVNAKVYPWLGDASAVLDLSTDGLAWPTLSPCTRLMFVRDAGGYGGAYAYVKVGASGGTVSATAATARAAPFPTIEAAMTAVQTWNNANRSHNTVGGASIRLMDANGSASTHTLGGSNSTNNVGLLVIEIDPAATANVALQFLNVQQIPNNVMIRGVEIQSSTNGFMIVGQNVLDCYCILSGCKLTFSASKSLMYWIGVSAFLNCTFSSGSVAPNLNDHAPTGGGIGSMIGCIVQANVDVFGTSPNVPGLYVGNHLPSDTHIYGTPIDGQVTYNNRVFWGALFSTTPITLARGIALAQNLPEQHTPTSSSVIAWNMLADGDLTTCAHILDMHQTVAGERSSRAYNDVAASRVTPNGIDKKITSKYSIWDNYNIKTDTFAATLGSACGCGNWAAYYGVGNRGCVSLFGQVNRSPSNGPSNGNTPEYLGGAWHSSCEYNLFRTALGFTQAQIMAMFTNWTAAPQASPTRFGNYQPVSGATYLKGRVPAGEGILKYDLTGALRRTDGTGAAGAYESA